MKRLLVGSLVLLALPTWAEIIPLSNQIDIPSSISVNEFKTRGSTLRRVKFDLNKVQAFTHPDHSQYKVLSENNIPFSQTVGEAQLPFKSLVVAGAPEDIEVTIDQKQAVDVSILSAPAQPEDCRCVTQQVKKWVPLKAPKHTNLYSVESLGKFRGQEMSRVTIYAGQSNLDKGETRFYPDLEAQISSSQNLDEMYSEDFASEYDYLIISPKSLISGLVEFVDYKTQSGLKVKVVTLEDVGATVDKITAYFKSEYDANKYKYALIVGTDDLFPNHKVRTSGSSVTPSDYPYFLMDSKDMIPDVEYGRVVAATIAEVKRQTAKWMNYQNHASDAAQYLRMIGIASNEGSDPSDNEYVQGIEKDLAAGYGITTTHFYQNDATSKPNFINDAFNKGVSYMVYLGHGSGTSWASTGSTYSTTSVKQMSNSSVLQPVIIDVACQNGILKTGYLGETFMNATNGRGDSIGAAMYYGGSVNISWHPPAIMAKGMVKQAIAQKLSKVGDIILAGHVYLMENYSDIESVRDNFEWYHLFGDPSSPMYFK